MDASGTAVVVEVLGGIALLLWGLRMVRTGVERTFGGRIQRAVKRRLRNRFFAFGTGMAVTMLLQSSTATSLLVASFAERGFVAAAPGLAAVLGADVGTAVVAQVLTFDLSLLGPALLFIGVLTFLAMPSGRRRNFGRIVIGLGLILLSLGYIADATEPIRRNELIATVLMALRSEPFLAIVIGVGLTWIAHSSLAILLLVISLTVAGVVPVQTGLFLVLGINLGGAMPAVTASLGLSRPARRLPLGNLICRLGGLLLILPTMKLWPDWLSLLEASPSRQIVDFHLLFNLLLALVFLPLIPIVRWGTAKLLPDMPNREERARPRHLDRGAFGTPALALAHAAGEVVRMGDVLTLMLRDTLEAVRSNDRGLARQVTNMDDVVDDFHEAIKLYLTELRREDLTAEEANRCAEIITYATRLEQVGDIIVMNLTHLVEKKIKRNAALAELDMAELVHLFEQIEETKRLSFGVFLSGDQGAAEQLYARKASFRALELRAEECHMARLYAGEIAADDGSAIYLDFLRDLLRINSLLIAVAYPLLIDRPQGRPLPEIAVSAAVQS